MAWDITNETCDRLPPFQEGYPHVCSDFHNASFSLSKIKIPYN